MTLQDLNKEILDAANYLGEDKDSPNVEATVLFGGLRLVANGREVLIPLVPKS